MFACPNLFVDFDFKNLIISQWFRTNNNPIVEFLRRIISLGSSIIVTESNK